MAARKLPHYIVVIAWAWRNGTEVVEIDAPSSKAAREKVLRGRLGWDVDLDNPDEVDGSVWVILGKVVR